MTRDFGGKKPRVIRGMLRSPSRSNLDRPKGRTLWEARRPGPLVPRGGTLRPAAFMANRAPFLCRCAKNLLRTPPGRQRRRVLPHGVLLRIWSRSSDSAEQDWFYGV
jgi:hypothetical protein